MMEINDKFWLEPKIDRIFNLETDETKQIREIYSKSLNSLIDYFGAEKTFELLHGSLRSCCRDCLTSKNDGVFKLNSVDKILEESDLATDEDKINIPSFDKYISNELSHHGKETEVSLKLFMNTVNTINKMSKIYCIKKGKSLDFYLKSCEYAYFDFVNKVYRDVSDAAQKNANSNQCIARIEEIKLKCFSLLKLYYRNLGSERLRQDFSKKLGEIELLKKASEISKKPIHKLSLKAAEEITDKESRRQSDLKMEAFLEEERLAKQKKKPRRRKKRKSTPLKATASKPLSSKQQPSTIVQKVEKISSESLRRKKSIEVHKRKSLTTLNRVNRWQCKDIGIIKQFRDHKDGKEIKRYENLSDDEILKQRAYHYLPGLQKLFMNKKDKDIYTFPTNRGLGMFAQLKRGEIYEYGIVYYGIGKDRKIFHRYFEQMDDTKSIKSYLIDKHDVRKSADDQDWELIGDCEFEFDANGIVTIAFPKEGHTLTIYPIRRDKLDKRIFS